LDANAWSARGFRHWLPSYHGPKRMPAVAYAELAVHFARARPLDLLQASFQVAGVQIEPLTAALARAAAELAAPRGDWERNARNYLIGAHAASPPCVLVTDNAADFDYLGARVRTPAQVTASPPR
jgi:predicted nucleic acid-binding protein